MLGDENSQAAKALQALGVSADGVEARLAETPLSTTSDAPPGHAPCTSGWAR